MVDQLVNKISPALSNARLMRYSANGMIGADTLVAYLWNMALAESLYSPLGLVEIALHNTLHSTLTAKFGTPNWYHGNGLLEPAQRVDVFAVERRIKDSGKSVTADRVVSELSFGFWVTILSRNYDARFWSSNNSSTLRIAFPRVPKPLRQRGIIHRRYNSIRMLRNRTFHHEPLFDDPGLYRRYLDIIDSIRWINPELLKLERLFDRFESVWKDGRSSIEIELQALT